MSGFEDNGGLDDGTAWEEFADALAGYLATMETDDDHLLVETPDGDSEEGATPYAQFCVAGPGRLRAEMSSNAFLAEPFKLTDEQVELMTEDLGWKLPDEPGEGQNFVVEKSVEDADSIAYLVREAFEDVFGIPHPTLMSARAWGPASAGVSSLGIPGSADVATDIVDLDESPSSGTGVIVPRDRDHLLELVRRFLTEYLGEEPPQDEDGDFVIRHSGLQVYVRARADQPVIDVFTRVVHDVRSPRQAAVELAVLNRDHLISRFFLHERAVYQVMNLPAMPFVPAHLRLTLPGFLALIDEVRADLVLRTSGRVV